MIEIKNRVKYLKLKKNSTSKVIWEFEGKPDDIEHIKTDCGCSSAYKDGNTIEVIYNHGDRATTKKHITLYLRDGKDLYVKVNGEKFINPLKEQIILTISGLVK